MRWRLAKKIGAWCDRYRGGPWRYTRHQIDEATRRSYRLRTVRESLRELPSIREWLSVEIPKILVENGLPPDATGYITCVRCRKVCNTDDQGRFGCDCLREEPGDSDDW